jgi:xanthine dehydrogenase iron-sulfur cluster and FAD-binding subunit A
MHIVIPDELVPLLRHELFSDLHSQLEEAGVLVASRGQADIRAAVDGCLGRADGTRALLDAVGWIEPIYPPAIVEIDVRRHRTTLLRTLLTRIESEHSVEEDPEASDDDRATAKARISQLADLIAQAETWGA